MEGAINNPLYGIEVGSIVYDTGSFGAPVVAVRIEKGVKKSMTRFIDQQSGRTTITGNSSYVYTADMNQGSLGVSGSYGLSGLSKLSGGLSAYLGRSTAQDSKTLSITWNHLKWAGIEYIDFNDLTVASFLSGLSESAQRLAGDSLKNYSEAVKLASGLTEEQVLNALGANKDSPLKTAFSKWMLTAESFRGQFGDGLVVGVVWGGWGAVNLKITTKTDATAWKGGGSFDFTYAGVGASVAVGATFNHEEAKKEGNVVAEASGFYNGACVQPIVNAWLNDVNGLITKGLSDLGKANIAELPALSGTVAAPRVPEFAKPEKSQKLTDLFTNIKNMDGLQAYAKAEAFEKQKKDGGTDDLAAFLDKAGKPNDVAGTELPVRLQPDEDDDDDPMDARIGDHGLGMDRPGGAVDLEEKGDAPEEPKGGQFEPLGVWVASWEDIFPWLASFHDNRIPAGNAPSSLVKLRIFHQDLITLSRLYRGFATSNLKWKSLDFGRVRDSFSHAAAKAGELISTLADRREGLKQADVEKIDAAIRSILLGLGATSERIYRKWDSSPAFRKAELGFGLIKNALMNDPARPMLMSTDEASRSLVLAPTNFDPARGNFDEFSSAVKAIPLLIPEQHMVRVRLYLLSNTEKGSGLVATQFEWNREIKRVTYTAEEGELLVDPDEFGNRATKDDPNILYGWYFNAYPIPFEAADGNAWKGISVASGFGNLPDQLDQIRLSVARKKQFSFDLDTSKWADLGSGDTSLSVQGLPVSYIGLTKEPDNIFHKNKKPDNAGRHPANG